LDFRRYWSGSKDRKMLKGINYWAFPAGSSGNPLHPVEAMRMAKELGYDCFELTVEQEGPVSLESSRSAIEQIRKEAEDIGIQLLTLASGVGWSISPTDPNPDVRKKAVANYRKTLEIASWLGVETILYLPGMVSAVFAPEFEPQRYDLVDQRARETLGELVPTAEKLEIKIGVENVWSRYLLSPLEMREFIDSFKSPMVGSYFDTGNVVLYGHPEHWIEILADRIFAVHVKDFRVNVGNLDGFVDILSGDVDFDRVMAALKTIGYEKTYTAEIVPGMPGCVEKAIAALEVLEQI